MKLTVRRLTYAIIISVLLSAVFGYQPSQAQTASCTFSNGGIHCQFANRLWLVRNYDAVKTSPSGNPFSDSASSVWVDQSGLHLKVRYDNQKSQWVNAEVTSDTPTSYGTHCFYVDSPVDSIDQNVILGLFIYKDDYHEIDQEFSKWGWNNPLNAQYVIQPSTKNGPDKYQYRFNISPSVANSMHCIDWESGYVEYWSIDGYYPWSTSPTIIDHQVRQKINIPQSDGTYYIHMNLWIYGGDADTKVYSTPSDTTRSPEIVIKNVTYYPTRFTDDFSTDKGWVDQSSGYVYPTGTDYGLSWTAARSHPIRYYIPLNGAQSDWIHLNYRFNVTSANGNGAFWFGFIENLSAPDTWGAGVTGVLTGLNRDTLSGTKVQFFSQFSDNTFDGIDAAASTINYGSLNAWRQLSLTIDHQAWFMMVADDNGNKLGEMAGLLPEQNSAYNYLGIIFDVPTGWETETGYLNNVVVDSNPPLVNSIARVDFSSVSSASSVHFTTTFSDPVTGVDASDFMMSTTGGIAGASISNITGSGTTYSVTVNTGSGNGTIRLDVVDNDSIHDQAGIPLGGAGVGNGNFATGETYTIIKASTFSDVPTSYWSSAWIERLYDAGITGGCSVGDYCPDQFVTRAQMAIFLERGMQGSSYVPPTVIVPIFSDVIGSYWAANWINQLAADGVTGGCGGGNYCPDQSVTRAQMAVFLLKSEHGSGYTPPPATGSKFTDVPASYWASSWIEQLANEGITSGCGTNLYCSDQSVTRAQMAVFLVKTFNLP